MNVYIETNFVLEMAREQEQNAHCREILDRAASGSIHLVVPVFSLVEPYHSVEGRRRERANLRRQLSNELYQLGRSDSYRQQAQALAELSGLLITSAEDEAQRLHDVRDELLGVAETIPLTNRVLRAAGEVGTRYGLAAQDAVVLASILVHLDEQRLTHGSLFVTTNSKDFGDAAIVADLKGRSCDLLFKFDDLVKYLDART